MKLEVRNRFQGALYFALSFGLCGASLGTDAAVQPEETVMLEKLEVTGSRIKRSDIEGASPVVVLDEDYIKRSGASTLSGLVKDVIYNTAGVLDESFTQGTAPGAAAIDLRGLGVNRTLVLVNGRRVPLFPFAQDGSASFVDINLIPLGAVARVEILKDGASAIYGSDAIAGVVNIVLRQDYDGAEFSLQLGTADEGGGDEVHLNAIGGLSSDKGNVTFVFDYFDRSAVWADDRDISKTANRGWDNRSNAGDPGTVIRPAQDLGPSPDPSCPAGSVNQEKGPFCQYDFAPWNTLIPSTRRLGLVASGDYELTEDLVVFFGANYTNSKSDRDLAPPAPNDVFVVAPDNPNNIFPGEPVLSIYRPTEMGPRTDDYETNAWNLVGGLKGYVGSWDWELGVGGGKINTETKGTNGYTTQDAAQAAIDSGSLNPFGPSPGFNPDSIARDTRRDGESSLFFTDLKATGDIAEMRHGVLSTAIGAEYRYEDFSDQWDPTTESGDVLGVGGTSGKGDRNSWALYAELNIPVLSTLEIDIAARYDAYSDFGGTFNPKLGLRWQPISNLLVRGSAGTGFKSPSLPELHSGEIRLFDAVIDPVTGEAVTVDTLTIGNPDLDAEESRNYGLGLVWDINRAWDFGVDYWRIKVDNAVSNDAQFYVNNESLFPESVIRGPGGEIEEVRNPFRNIAEQRVWGIDFSTNATWSISGAGDFGLNIVASYLGSFEEKKVPGADSVERAGNDGRPRWRGQASLTWDKADYRAAVILNYVGGYDRVTETIESYKVDSWTTIDAQFDWTPSAIQGSTITLGINNLFDEKPPEETFWDEGWPWYNRALHSARGRFLYARYKHAF